MSNYDPNATLFYRSLNWLRRIFGLQEKRYMTDMEWREHMRSIVPKNIPRNGPTP